MINLYWPIYKSLEKEVLELSNQLHFDDNQLKVYSTKIAELIIRSAVEIESISKDLYFRLGGSNPSEGSDLYFDTDCIELLEKTWLLSKKEVLLVSPNFHFTRMENRILKPLHKANKRGVSGSDWKRAYQAIKHNRVQNLNKGNLKNLLRILASLYLLNLYFKEEVFPIEKDNIGSNLPANFGSDIYSVVVHDNPEYIDFGDGFFYKKDLEFEKSTYLIKYTERSLNILTESRKKKVPIKLQYTKYEAVLNKND